MVSEVNGDAGAEHNAKRVAEGLPHGMALPFSLPQIGGFSFGPNSGKMANIMRLPWGGARSKIVAYVRGADLISNHHNGPFSSPVGGRSTSRGELEPDGMSSI